MKLPIYIISDNHFLLEDTKEEKKRRQKLFDLFQTIKETEGTLIIGGDFFDFWLEFIGGPPLYYDDILNELERLHNNNITIHYVLGNHDYWDFGYFQKKFGCLVHKQDFSFTVDNKNILITHGDGILKHDYLYRFMKKIIRSKLIMSLFRLIPHPHNFTPILASAIMAPILIKDRLYAIAIPIVGMFVSDLIIGFHPYQFVVYFTILTIALVSPMHKNYAMLGMMAVGGSIWFFVTTNFAVWIVWDYYPKTFEGLLTSYTLAIPFFKNTLISTCLFTGLLIILIKYIRALNKKTNYFIFNLISK